MERDAGQSDPQNKISEAKMFAARTSAAKAPRDSVNDAFKFAATSTRCFRLLRWRSNKDIHMQSTLEFSLHTLVPCCLPLLKEDLHLFPLYLHFMRGVGRLVMEGDFVRDRRRTGSISIKHDRRSFLAAGISSVDAVPGWIDSVEISLPADVFRDSCRNVRPGRHG
jgi:hypothetical protein